MIGTSRKTPMILGVLAVLGYILAVQAANPTPASILAEYDADKDGFLSVTEFNTFVDKLNYARTTGTEKTGDAYPCLTATRVFSLYDDPNQDGSGDLKLDANEFAGALTHFTLQATQESCTPNSPVAVDPHAGHAHANPSTCGQLSEAEVWITSILVSIAVTFISLIGLVLLASKRETFLHLIPILLMFGVGSLLANSIFHLIPEALELHSHSEDAAAEEENKDYLGKGAVMLVGIGLFFMLEQLVHHFAPHSHIAPDHHHGPHDHSHAAKLVAIDQSSETASSDVSASSNSSTTASGTASGSVSASATVSGSSSSTVDDGGSDVSSLSSTAPGLILKHDLEGGDLHKMRESGPVKSPVLMVIFAEALHNFTDGLIIGTTFAISLAAGFASTLAIVFHEIPQEISDFVVLVNYGYSVRKALWYNFLSGLPAILGAMIGAGVGASARDSTPWLASIAAGGFIYIALAVLTPELIEGTRNKSGVYRFILFIVLTVSIIIQWLIARHSEDIKFAC